MRAIPRNAARPNLRIVAPALLAVGAVGSVLFAARRTNHVITRDLQADGPAPRKWVPAHSALSCLPPRWTCATPAGATVIPKRMVNAIDHDWNGASAGSFASQATDLLAAYLFAASCSALVPVAKAAAWLSADNSVQVTQALSKLVGLGIKDTDRALEIVQSIWTLPSATREGIVANAASALATLPASDWPAAPGAA